LSRVYLFFVLNNTKAIKQRRTCKRKPNRYYVNNRKAAKGPDVSSNHLLIKQSKLSKHWTYTHQHMHNSDIRTLKKNFITKAETKTLKMGVTS